MNKSRFALLLLPIILGTAVLPNPAFPARTGETLPNIVFFFADDIGWADPGRYHEFYADGINQPIPAPVPTPNLNRLCDEGMMFTDAQLPAALCAPNRFCVMTGNYSQRSRPTGTWNRTASSAFHFGNSEDDRINNPHKTAGDLLQAAGYRTAYFGKMHFGGDFYDSDGKLLRSLNNSELHRIDYARRFDNGLRDHGFDYTFVTPDGIQGPVYAYFENDLFRPVSSFAAEVDGVSISGPSYLRSFTTGDTVGNGEMIQDGYGDSEFDTSEHGPILAHFAREFIEDHVTNHPRNPFMLYYATPAIHVPHTPSTAGILADGATGLGERADFVYDLDQQLGLLLEMLDDLDIADNTIVIFTSDNGGYPGINGRGGDGMVDAGQWPNGPLRANKGSIYEGGHRVPFIWKWGDGTEAGSVIRPGSVCGQLVSVIDWVASVVDLTGGAITADQQYDAVSLLPLLFSNAPDTEDPVRTMHYYHCKDQRGIRMNDSDGKWFYKRTGTIELYDLATDIAQSANLVEGYSTLADVPGSHPHKARLQAMDNWYLAHNATYDARSETAHDYGSSPPKTPIPVPVPAPHFAINPNLILAANSLEAHVTYEVRMNDDLSGPWSVLETIPETSSGSWTSPGSVDPGFYLLTYPEKAEQDFLPLPGP
jgi:arylsulfatase A-like enzyme